MSNEKEIWMETTHGRKSKCKTEFKAVVNKVLISTLVLTTILGSTTPAFASQVTLSSNQNDTNIVQEYGVSVESAISNLKNTIATINSMKAKGSVSNSVLKTLANQLYSLSSAVKSSGDGVTANVKSIINSAEKAISGLSNAGDVKVALAVVKADLGMDSVTVQNKQANTLKSFSDVPSSHWTYDAIMDMAINKGLIAGTTAPNANGVGTFEPNATMTRAQFITVVTRYLYKDELNAFESPEGAPWYMANYAVALQEGLLETSDFTVDELSVPMTRQEMAMVLVRAMDEMGESISGATISNSRIPDYSSIGTKYRSYVKIAYTKGLICGTDSTGTFSPMGTLTRAQAATVIYRLIEEDTRTPVNVKESGDSSIDIDQDTGVVSSGISWTEGQTHGIPKAGDTVIKADGTKVVLKVGPGGVLGAGQGVNIWAGCTKNGVTVKEGMSAAGVVDNDGTVFVYNEYSGEMHTQLQWSAIEGATSTTLPDGNDFEHGYKPNYWWQWNGIIGTWMFLGGR